MNSNQRKFGLMAAMMMMAATGNEMPEIEPTKRQVTFEWSRKKCKSCNLFPCNNDLHKYKPKPLAQACEKYEKRK